MSIGMEALQSVGITRSYMVLGAVCLIIAGTIGIFWRFILPGAIIVATMVLFVDPAEVKDPPKTQVKTEVFDEHGAYMQDCITVAEYTKEQCELLWQGKQLDHNDVRAEATTKVTPIEVDNEEYKQRRAETLAKPNAVIIHETYH